MFWFSLQGLSQTFPILRRNEQNIIKNVYWSSCTVPVIVVRIRWKLNFSTGFEMYSNIKLHEIPSSESRVVPSGWAHRWTNGQTDRYDETDRRFSRFSEKRVKYVYNFVVPPPLPARPIRLTISGAGHKSWSCDFSLVPATRALSGLKTFLSTQISDSQRPKPSSHKTRVTKLQPWVCAASS